MTQRLIELKLDESSLWDFFDSIADHVPQDISNEDLLRFIRSGFILTNGAPRTDGTLDLYIVVFKPNDALLELLPALRAGEIDFGTLNNVLKTKTGILDELSHE